MAIDARNSSHRGPRPIGHEDEAVPDVASIERAAVQRLRSRHSTVNRSFVAVASAERATVRQSTAGVVVAQSLAADQVRAVVVVAPVVRGEIHALFDLRAAVAIGFGMALGRGFLAVLRRAFRR